MATQFQGSREHPPQVQINVYNIIHEGNEHIYTIEGKVGFTDIEDLTRQTKDSLELLNAQIDLEKAKIKLEEVRNGKRYRKIK